MLVKRSVVFGLICGAFMLAGALVESTEAQGSESLAPVEKLGKALFLDSRLSAPQGMSCASCHGPTVGFTGEDEYVNLGGAVYPGAVPSRFGNRKPPAAAYAGESPVLSYDASGKGWIGGMFWDGRATGWTLDDPLAEQAQGPFLNPLEHNAPNAHFICMKVKLSGYACLFKQVWHQTEINCVRNVDQIYEQIGRSIAAYERSEEVSPYSSKYDEYLRGETTLSAEEQWGLTLFEEKAGCATCHTSTPGPGNAPPVLTDFSYDNLGVPKNESNPFYTMPPKWNPDGEDWEDEGLGGFLRSANYGPEVFEQELGKQKVPTLRNVDLRPTEDFIKAYGHNGYFKSLAEIIHFYNTRDVAGEGWMGEPWPAPEIPENINTSDIGDLGLSVAEESAIVAFLKTLSDDV